MKKLILLLSICSFSINTFSQTKKEKIHTLLNEMGSGKTGVIVAKTMIDAFKKNYPKVDQKIWDEFAKEIKSEDLIEMVVPVYDKYYTEDDVDQLLAFYKTPIGKKSIEVMPQIAQESMLAGQSWGKQIGEKIAKKLKDQGY